MPSSSGPVEVIVSWTIVFWPPPGLTHFVGSVLRAKTDRHHSTGLAYCRIASIFIVTVAGFNVLVIFVTLSVSESRSTSSL